VEKLFSEIEETFDGIDLDIAGEIALSLAAGEEAPSTREIWRRTGIPKSTAGDRRPGVLHRVDDLIGVPAEPPPT
jgi:hypothetical protein